LNEPPQTTRISTNIDVNDPRDQDDHEQKRITRAGMRAARKPKSIRSTKVPGMVAMRAASTICIYSSIPAWTSFVHLCLLCRLHPVRFYEAGIQVISGCKVLKICCRPLTLPRADMTIFVVFFAPEQRRAAICVELEVGVGVPAFGLLLV